MKTDADIRARVVELDAEAEHAEGLDVAVELVEVDGLEVAVELAAAGLAVAEVVDKMAPAKY